VLTSWEPPTETFEIFQAAFTANRPWTSASLSALASTVLQICMSYLDPEELFSMTEHYIF
jgi:hypothetical protein